MHLPQPEWVGHAVMQPLGLDPSSISRMVAPTSTLTMPNGDNGPGLQGHSCIGNESDVVLELHLNSLKG